MSDQQSLRLHIRGVSKSYGAVKALKSVELCLKPGEVMALLGENGAGKSTVVKVISGLVKPDAGKIEIDGYPVDLSSTAKAQAAGVAVVQQEYSSVPTMTVAENLALGNHNSGRYWGKKGLNRKAIPLLKEVGLDHIDPDNLVETLSVAEMQLLEIARMLARDAKIVVFDEPTAALSDAEITSVLALVRRLASKGISVIYVTHRLPEVFEISDRITIFRNGESSPPIETRNTTVDELVTQMLGRELNQLYPAKSAVFGEIRLRADEVLVPGLRAPVSFTVRMGEILGLTGQIGSGLDSLVDVLAGLLPAESGQIELDGVGVDLHGRSAGIRQGIAYCSSDRKRDGIFGGLSIQQNLSSPWLSSVSRAGVLYKGRERNRSLDIAHQFAIDSHRLASPVGTLSGGNQQKVAVGKWLGIDARVLLIAEPTRGVDVGARADIYAKLRSLCDSGLTVIVSSSDTAEIFGLADTIATFYHGTMSVPRPSEEWTENELVREVMHRAENGSDLESGIL